MLFSLLFFSFALSRSFFASLPLLSSVKDRKDPSHAPLISLVCNTSEDQCMSVRRDSSVTLTPSPQHDLYWLTSCSPRSGFTKTAEGACEHVYDPCHFWHVSNRLPRTFMFVLSVVWCCRGNLFLSAQYIWNGYICMHKNSSINFQRFIPNIRRGLLKNKHFVIIFWILYHADPIYFLSSAFSHKVH